MPNRKIANYQIGTYVGGRMRVWEKDQEIDLDDDTAKQILAPDMYRVERQPELKQAETVNKVEQESNGDS